LPSPPGRIPALDGLRALSIALVLGAHLIYAHPEFDPGDNLSILFDGQLGVRVFFVISGFLITTLLDKEQKATGTISLGRFYVRRAIRLFPAQYAFVAFLFVLTLVTPTGLTACRFVTALTYTKNYACGGAIDGHLWSLAVEEQFYLIWAVAFARMRRSRAVALAVLLICVAPLSRTAEYQIGHRFYPWLTSNADALMIGCLLAILAAESPPVLRRIVDWRPRLARCVAVAAILLPTVFSHEHWAGKLTVTTGPLVQALAIAFLIASLVYNGGSSLRVLDAPAVRYVGTISYSLYLWQMPFLVLDQAYGGRPQWFLAFPLDLLLAFAAANASYWVLERPLTRLRRNLHRDAGPSDMDYSGAEKRPVAHRDFTAAA